MANIKPKSLEDIDSALTEEEKDQLDEISDNPNQGVEVDANQDLLAKQDIDPEEKQEASDILDKDEPVAEDLDQEDDDDSDEEDEEDEEGDEEGNEDGDQGDDSKEPQTATKDSGPGQPKFHNVTPVRIEREEDIMPEKNPTDYQESDNLELPQSQPPSSLDELSAPVEHNLDDLAEEDDSRLVSSLDKIDQNPDRKIPMAGHLSPEHMPTSGIYSNRNFSPADRPQEFHGAPSKKSNKLHLLILGLIGLAVIGGTVFLLKGLEIPNIPFLSQAPTPTPTPEPTPTPVPTPTPEPEIDRTQFKIRVLNGTPKTGFASEIRDKLKAKGYQIDRVGNATNSAFPQTVIRLKESAASLSAQLIKDLAPDLEAQEGGILKANDAADAEIILGAK